jgi:hypothetical protein
MVVVNVALKPSASSEMVVAASISPRMYARIAMS